MKITTRGTLVLLLAVSGWIPRAAAGTGPLLAGVAKVEITDREARPVNDPLYAKALVLKNDATALVLVTIDAVALEEIGCLRRGFLAEVRGALGKDPGLAPASVIVNASHCHGTVRSDSAALAVQAVQAAWQSLVPVKVGAGRGREDRIQENRRLRMKDGSQLDVRRAYAMPRDADVADVGPVDPDIGLLRIDRIDGRPLAALYTFACHPIEGVPSQGNSADFPGFASKVIEEELGDGALAFFVQGCAGDVNPVIYKDLHQPHDAEPLGNLLGLSAMRALRTIRPGDDLRLQVVRETIALPRATDYDARIAAIEAAQAKLVRALRGTNLNLKTFVPLLVQYKLADDYPAYYSHRYLREKALGKDDLEKMDAENRANLEAYLQNVQVMEQLSRLNTNLALLKMHQAQTRAADGAPLEVEIAGLRVGPFVLLTFPGELSVEIGLGLKKASPHPLTFVAGYTNGYIYYAPTAAERVNPGFAQEDCDCLLAPQWQEVFQTKALEILRRL